MPDPAVSIVIPAYNHGAYLATTINSALAQTWPDFELIVVDDGSSDDTPDVAASFGAAIRFIRQENRGMAGSRNTGIKHARGEFVGFLDDDDLWEPDYLAQVIPALRNDSGAGACRAGYQIMDGAGSRLPQTTARVVAPDQMFDALIDGGFFPPCTVTVRKAAFDHLGVFDTNLQGLADWDMWLRISSSYRYLSIPEILVLYRVHRGGLSSNVEHMFDDHLKAIRKHFGPEDEEPTRWPIARRRAYAGAYLSAALGYYQRGDSEKGEQKAIRAFQVYPHLATKVETFYELALADQPRGFRGLVEPRDLEERASHLYAMLDAVHAGADLELTGMSAAMTARANLALSMLADQSGNWKLARRYMRRAATADPGLLADASVVRRALKLTAGKPLTDLLHRR